MYTTILNSSFTKNIKNIIIYDLLMPAGGFNISIQVRPYLIYNQNTLFNIIIPHMAIEVRTLDNRNQRCTSETYGLVRNSKVYSPDILTSGRTCASYKSRCKNNCKPCRKDIFPGYWKKYLTDWLVIPKPEAFINSINKKQLYNPLFQNSASFVSSAMRAGGIDFTCKTWFGIDTIESCKLLEFIMNE